MADTYYAWDPEFDCITKETDAAGVVTARYTQEPRPFGGLISQDRGGVSSFYHYDAIGSTRALTDISQTVTDTAVYTAFGEKVTSTGTTANPFGYVGQVGYLANQNRNLYIRRRFLSTTNAKWQSKDIIDDDILLNTYRYCINIPTYNIDPSGLVCSNQPTPCPRRDTKELYRFPKVNTTDGSNGLPIQIKNVSLSFEKCGLFKWKLKWFLKDPVGENGGYVLQSITARLWVGGCDWKAKTRDFLGGQASYYTEIEPGVFETNFWEAWRIEPLQSQVKESIGNSTWDDSFGTAEGMNCSVGWIALIGKYVRRDTDLPAYFSHDPNGPWGKAWFARTGPSILPSDKPGDHVIVATWDCCFTPPVMSGA